MTEFKTSCPTVDQLKALIDSSLPGKEQTAIQSHVDECVACQQTLESLVAVSESWDSELGHLRDEPAPVHEAVLSDAMRQMKAEEFVDSREPADLSRASIDFLEPSDYPNSIGKLGTYEVTEVIGQGGMGIVLKAFDPALHRVVAVKVLAPYLAHNPQARKRFVREAQAIAAVSHDHVITIHAIDESAEQPKIVMQYVAGRSLQQKIDAEGSLELKEILRIGMQTASGLAAAHAQGLVHRDVKPSNILLENGIQRVKLTDFGLARAVDDASLTQSGAIAGTPQYMAPEQANGDAVDYRADLFSLGSVLYAMCVGHSPFRASTTMGVLKRVCHDPPRRIQELNADIPDWLCAIVMKLLAKKPEERFQSAKAVAELLETWLAHVQQPTVVAKPASIPYSTPSFLVNASAPGIPDAHSKASAPRQHLMQDNAGTTILFQAISGRLLLFFFLVGMAGSLVFTHFDRRIDLPEALGLGLICGLFVSFWGLLFVALVRLFWANIRDFIPWGAKATTANDESESPGKLKNITPSTLGGLPPESVAMLAAIVMMLLSFNPLLAAIAAIIVWRVATSYVQPAGIPVGNGPTFSGSSFKHAANSSSNFQPSSSRTENLRKGFASLSSAAVTQLNRQMKSVSEGTSSLLKNLRTRAQGFFSSAATERNRLLISIGWCFVGGLDLCLAVALGERHLLWQIVWSMLGIISLTVAHCIQVGQNVGLVRSMSYLGLIPLSIGSMGRIPLSVATLFWLKSVDESKPFDAAPFSGTKLGGLIQGLLSLLLRSLVTTGWLLVWTIGWGVAAVAMYLFLLIPYGPFHYDIYDKAIVTPNSPSESAPLKPFELTASGSGTAMGSSSKIEGYRRQFLGIGQVGGTRESQTIVELFDPMGSVISDEQLKFRIQSALNGLYKKRTLMGYPQYTESLARSVQRMITSDIQANSTPFIQRSTIALFLQRIDELGKSPRSVSTPWDGFVRLGSLTDPNLFQVELDTNASYFDSHLSKPVIVLGVTLALLGWFAGCLWVLRRNPILRNRLRTVEAVTAA